MSSATHLGVATWSEFIHLSFSYKELFIATLTASQLYLKNLFDYLFIFHSRSNSFRL